MGKARKDILISLREVPKFLLTGQVVVNRQGGTEKYKRRGLKFAGPQSMRGTYFFTGDRKE